MQTSETFQPIDTQLILDTAIRQARMSGTELSLTRSYSGVYTGHFGESFLAPDGTQMKPMLFLRNANDGGTALNIGVGLFRFVCQNGLVVGDSFYSNRIIHRKGPTVDEFLMNLDKNLEAAFQIAGGYFEEKLEQLHSVQVSEDTGIQIVGSLSLPESVKHGAMYMWCTNPRQEDGRNLLGLYNSINEANRRKSNSSQSFDRELGLLPQIEALHEFEMRKAA